jgi:hypothetical protein
MAVTQAILVDELSRQAREAHPGQGLATAIAAVFTVIGWTAGRLVTGMAFAGLCIRFGYLRGRGFSDEEITARRAPEPETAQLSNPRL